MESLKFRPSLSPRQAESIAKELFGIAASAEELPSERDQNFLLDTFNDETYVLKVSNGQTRREILEAENTAIKQLLTAQGPSSCPSLVPSQNHKCIEVLANDAAPDRHHFVRLLTYVEGTPLVQLSRRTEALATHVGKFAAAVCSALSQLEPHDYDRQLQWDLKCADQVVGDHYDAINSAPLRQLVLKNLNQYLAATKPNLDKLRTSVIHNDLNDHNLIVADNHQRIAAIDFGDMVYTHTINELAILLAYLLLDSDDPIALALAAIRAFHEQLPLKALELECLPDLIKMRLSTSISLAAHRAIQAAQNEYLAVTAQPAARLLTQLDQFDPHFLTDRFLEACQPHKQSLRDAEDVDVDNLVIRRNQSLGEVLSLAYDDPLHIVRGHATSLFDANGRAYLDLVNNVCHVGHCHPHVARAISKQVFQLNTNTRYLHTTILEYVERLLATFPDHLDTCFLVNSGSEANDLALRLARSFTGSMQTIVIDHAYHGHLTSLIEISPYKFNGPGGTTCEPHVHVVPLPDGFRGRYREDAGDLATRYAQHVESCCHAIGGPCTFLAESMPGCGGQIEFLRGYLQQAYEHVHQQGGVCIADEVQVGFGRVGSHFWAFQTQGVDPDIVTLGKPIANGHPLGAVVTTRALAERFNNGMEYFNTFGGNPVSASAGLAVLETIQQEKLQPHAEKAGLLLKKRLQTLQQRTPTIGEVRGRGLFLGIELVHPTTRTPHAELAKRICEQAKSWGLLLSRDGPDHNVLKIKPPLSITTAQIEVATAILGEIFTHNQKS